MSLANLITLARLPLLLVVVALLFVPSFGVQLTGLGLLIVLFLLDWFDGYVARARRELGFVHEPLDAYLGKIVASFLAHPPGDRPPGYADREIERAAASPGVGPTA